MCFALACNEHVHLLSIPPVISVTAVLASSRRPARLDLGMDATPVVELRARSITFHSRTPCRANTIPLILSRRTYPPMFVSASPPISARAPQTLLIDCLHSHSRPISEPVMHLRLCCFARCSSFPSEVASRPRVLVSRENCVFERGAACGNLSDSGFTAGSGAQTDV